MRRRFGFTIIEVSLFLAVTGLLFLGVTIGVQNSIYQQRYNDVVQSFTNFMRNVYDEVMNVQSLSNGRQKTAIYGKLLTFGENNTEEEQVAYVYDVIGLAANSSDLGSGTTLGLLKKLGADVITYDEEEKKYEPVGIIESYKPSWGARIQNKDNFSDYKGSILIVRDPKSGTVRTFVNKDVIRVNDSINSINATIEEGKKAKLLTDLLTSDKFGLAEIDFCINPSGTIENNRRTDVRLLRGAMNSSGVETLPLDGNDNLCNRK